MKSLLVVEVTVELLSGSSAAATVKKTAATITRAGIDLICCIVMFVLIENMQSKTQLNL